MNEKSPSTFKTSKYKDLLVLKRKEKCRLEQKNAEILQKRLSTDFLHYRIPQMGDMPRTYVDMVNSHDPYGPHGAKSVGELATVPVAPAIVNAVRRASGIEINSLPLCDKFAILPTERGNVK